MLPCLLRPFSHVLYHLPLGTVTSLVQQLTNLPQSATAPAPTNLHLAAVLQNKVRLPAPPGGQQLRGQGWGRAAAASCPALPCRPPTTQRGPPDAWCLSPQFGLSLLYLVLSRGEELQSSDTSTELMQDNQW